MMLEIMFKGERKEIYNNPQEFPFIVGDYAIVEAEKGLDLGVVNQIGSLLERKKKDDKPIRNIVRRPLINDLERYERNKQKEFDAYQLGRRKIEEHNLNMKLVDVEYQFDNQKITFYFTADKRIDFRELVKDLAGIYKVRIELRQIGVRDEAKRIGGHGCCGRKLCCTSFLKSFDPITTQCAKDQNLPLNPQKLSGLCGRLLCCLQYEHGFYCKQQEKLPLLNSTVKMKEGNARVVNVDVFKEEVTLKLPDDKYERFTADDLKEYKIIAPVEVEGEKETRALDDKPSKPNKSNKPNHRK